MKLKPSFFAVLAIDLVLSALVARFAGIMTQSKDLMRGFKKACNGLLDPSVMPPVNITTYGLLAAFVAFVLILYAYFHYEAQGTYRRGEEHGSAKWITRAEVLKYGDKEIPLDNAILSQEVRLRYRRGKDYRYDKNRNVLLVGGSGSGKTRGYYKPNIMQVPCPALAGLLKGRDSELDHYARSYFITDPKGTTRAETGYVFAEHGYKVKEFNLINPDASMGYNPIKYIRSEEAVMSFATCLIKNTTPPDAGKGDHFWEDSEKLLYQALIEYMRTEVPIEDRNLVTLCEILDLGQVDPNSGTMSGLDILFTELETGKRYDPQVLGSDEDKATGDSLTAVTHAMPSPWRQCREPQPNHPAVLAYRSFKSGAAETLQSILISCKVRLAPLRPKKIQRILARDEMELDKFGEEKIACYAVMSANDPTYNFLFAMMIWQLFDELMRQGALKYADQEGALPVGVDFLLDEFANYYIPNFEHTISVVRSYNIGAHIGLQSTSQLKDKYNENNATTIMNNCDALVFLGGKAVETNKELAEIIGQQTVTTDNESNQHSKEGSWSQTIAQHGRDLLQASEIAKLPKDECLVLIQGADPYKGKKYDVTSHPLYGYIDPGANRPFKRVFDFAAYRSDPQYYKHGDAQLAFTVRAKLFMSTPATLHPPRRRAYCVLFQTVIENVGDVTAYDLHGMAELDVTCETNRGLTPVYPLMEPFGTAEGLAFLRTETYSNRIAAIERYEGQDDIIEWNDSNEAYTLHGINLEPGQRVIYTTTVDAGIEDVLSRMVDPNEGYMRPSTASRECVFGFEYSLEMKCANHDNISAREKRALSVCDNGVARLLPAPGEEGAQPGVFHGRGALNSSVAVGKPGKAGPLEASRRKAS